MWDRIGGFFVKTQACLCPPFMFKSKSFLKYDDPVIKTANEIKSEGEDGLGFLPLPCAWFSQSPIHSCLSLARVIFIQHGLN